MYYLQSRYYNPEWGRFLNTDSSISTGQGLLGNNMYAYCLNNPANGCDPCGTCFHRWDFWNDCEKCGGKTLGDKWNDVVRWCEDAYNYMTNDNPQVVQRNLKKDHFSFYKGTMVFSASLPIDRSGATVGVIVLDDYYETVPLSSFEKTLNHERGHSVHMSQTGVVAYLSTTAIPSAICAAIADPDKPGFRKWMSDNYYNLPTERIADYFGGVNRGYPIASNVIGTLFWLYSLAGI